MPPLNLLWIGFFNTCCHSAPSYFPVHGWLPSQPVLPVSHTLAHLNTSERSVCPFSCLWALMESSKGTLIKPITELIAWKNDRATASSRKYTINPVTRAPWAKWDEAMIWSGRFLWVLRMSGWRKADEMPQTGNLGAHIRVSRSSLIQRENCKE